MYITKVLRFIFDFNFSEMGFRSRRIRPKLRKRVSDGTLWRCRPWGEFVLLLDKWISGRPQSICQSFSLPCACLPRPTAYFVQILPKYNMRILAVGRRQALDTFFILKVSEISIINLFIQGSAASASWEKEFQDYGWKSNLMTIDLFNTGIGHATQMAWAKSNLIGCGVKDCGRDSNGLNKVTVVCQYKPQ